MALIRCMDHPPDTDVYDWTVAINPVGYPETALLCGYRTHTEPVPGVAWLREREYRQFQRGRRVFSLAGSSTQIHLSDTIREGERIEVPRPPEPSADELEAGGNTSMDAGDGPEQSAPITQLVGSYLWDESWGESLVTTGLDREAFLSRTTEVSPVIEEWADAGRAWDDVLEQYADTLAIDLQ